MQPADPRQPELASVSMTGKNQIKSVVGIERHFPRVKCTPNTERYSSNIGGAFHSSCGSFIC